MPRPLSRWPREREGERWPVVVRLLPSSSRRKEAEVWGGVDLPRGPKGGLPNGGAGAPRPAEPLEVLLSAEAHRSLGSLSACV